MGLVQVRRLFNGIKHFGRKSLQKYNVFQGYHHVLEIWIELLAFEENRAELGEFRPSQAQEIQNS